MLLCGAFFRTQVIQHDKFQLKAETNRLRPIPLTPPRGSILDRQGRIIAENVPGYSVKLLLIPQTRSGRCLRGCASSCRSTAARWRTSSTATSRRAINRPWSSAMRRSSIAKLEEHRAALPGLVIQAEPKRLYPAGKSVAHLVGLRLRSDGGRSEGRPLPRRSSGLDRRQSWTGAAIRRHPAWQRRRTLHRSERQGTAGTRGGGIGHAPAHPGKPDQYNNGSRPAALHRQHLACRSSWRHGGTHARRRSPGSVLGTNFDPNTLSAASRPPTGED